MAIPKVQQIISILILFQHIDIVSWDYALYKIEIIDEGLSQVQRSTIDAVSEMRPPPELIQRADDAVNITMGIADNLTPIADAWLPVIEKLDIFSKIVEKVSEVRFIILTH